MILASRLVLGIMEKAGSEFNAFLIQNLPQLLQKLRGGMSLLGVAPSEQEGYVKTINDTLVDAFLSRTQAITDEQIQVTTSRLANLEDFLSEGGMGDLPLDAQSIEMMLGMDASQIDVVVDGGASQRPPSWRGSRLWSWAPGSRWTAAAGRPGCSFSFQTGLLSPEEEAALTVRATLWSS